MKTINACTFIKTALVIFCLASINACSTSHFPWVYRLDIEQGNIVEDEQLAQVKIGMTQSQVRYLLGTPMIKDTFNKNRWDYFYSFRTGDGLLERRLLTLHFEADKLSQMDEKPAESYEL